VGLGKELPMNRTQVFHKIREHGAEKALVTFSGGNDEGGADSVDLVKTDPENPEKNITMVELGEGDDLQETIWSAEERRYVPNPAFGPEERAKAEFFSALVAPVYDRYHTFAGEFYVHGTVTWDATTGKVSMDKTETVEHYESDTVEL
jgi:hypothetical protein